MSPLVEIHRNKWTALRDLYRNNWPENALPFCFLDTQVTYPNIAEFCNIKIYCPEGVLTNGFVAIFFNNMDVAYQVMIWPLDSIDKIEKALADTSIVKWSKILYFAATNLVVEDCLRRLEQQLGIYGKTKPNKAYRHFIDRSSKHFDISVHPPETYVADLKPEHLHIVDKTWTFHSDRSYKFFKSLVKLGLTYVLYSTKDDSPLAWITIDWEGCLTHLYCMEEHRRKGYAEYILKFAANDQLKKGKDVLGYTLENNVKPQRLFDKLKFARIGYDSWIHVAED